MKKLIANLLIWCLGKLGYEKNYQNKHTIKIHIDTGGADKKLKRLTEDAERLKKILDKI